MTVPKKQTTTKYKNIPGFPGYRVGDDGSVWSCRTRKGASANTTILSNVWKKLKFGTGSGYRMVNIGVGENRVPRYVHRLVLETFIGPSTKGRECCHNNGKRSDNRLTNLRWDSRSANCKDAVKHGTQSNGEKQWMSKLTNQDVRAIRKLWSTGEYYQRELAEKYNVSVPSIGMLVNGKTWKYLK